MSEAWAIIVSGIIGGACMIAAAFIGRKNIDSNSRSIFSISGDQTEAVAVTVLGIGFLGFLVLQGAGRYMVPAIGEAAFIYLRGYFFVTCAVILLLILILRFITVLRGKD